MKILLLLLPSLLGATAYTSISAGGNWNVAATWGGSGIPGFGDTAYIPQGTVTCPESVTCDVGTVGSTSQLNIGDGTHAAALTVAGTLILRGTGIMTGAFNDCSHGPTVTLSDGTLQMDEGGGSTPSGFVSGTTVCTIFDLGMSGEVCTWGTSTPTCSNNVTSINNGSANGVLLADGGTNEFQSPSLWGQHCRQRVRRAG